MENDTVELDRIDRRILVALQRDATLSLAALSEAVGLSSNACWKRIRKLENDGIILKRVTLLNADRLNLGLTAFVAVRTSQHDESWLEAFSAGVSRIPEVVEFHRMSGQIDYMLKIVCRDIGDYDQVYKKLIRSARLSDVSAAFAMEKIKSTTELPIG